MSEQDEERARAHPAAHEEEKDEVEAHRAHPAESTEPKDEESKGDDFEAHVRGRM